jgi:hypothetical protein
MPNINRSPQIPAEVDKIAHNKNVVRFFFRQSAENSGSWGRTKIQPFRMDIANIPIARGINANIKFFIFFAERFRSDMTAAGAECAQHNP